MTHAVNKVGIPYDPIHPFEFTLNPGETVTLYGNITFTNNTNEAVHIKLRFDLQKGFQASIDGSPEVSVKMHQNYPVDPKKSAVAGLLQDAFNKMAL
jgi:hypothetical protein